MKKANKIGFCGIESRNFKFKQLEKILALYQQKTEYFSPSTISKTREELCFCKNSLSKHQ